MVNRFHDFFLPVPRRIVDNLLISMESLSCLPDALRPKAAKVTMKVMVPVERLELSHGCP